MCYAQTELAHGSYVKGIRTTATLDRNSDCFILNTPDTGATKWWIGGLGKVANHAILIARLVID